jgi:hypothetical protein
MPWIDLTDKERLYRWARSAGPKSATLYEAPKDAESFFIESQNRPQAHIPDIMPYEPQSILGFHYVLETLWKDMPPEERELLRKIVTSAALKHEPCPVVFEKDKKLKGDAVSENSSPAVNESKQDAELKELTSIFVYEF